MAEGAPPSKNLAHRLTTQDASFLYGESTSGPLHIGSLAIFDGEVDYARLLEHLERRMHLLPRYRQKLGFVPFNLAHATWEDDPEFDLRHHIFSHKLPRDTHVPDAVEAMLRIYETPLDRKLPLWEMHLFNGIKDGRSALAWKVHHCLVDGVSGMELLTITLDFRPDAAPPAPPEKPWKPNAMPTPARALIRAAFDLAQANVETARRAAEQLLENPATIAGRNASALTSATRVLQRLGRPIVPAPWSAAPVTQSRSLAWVRTSFGDLRKIRAEFGGTLNDVVLTMLGEGAARYFVEHQVKTASLPLRIGCPVNVRRGGEDASLGNRVSMMFPELDSSPMDPVERLRAVTKETERIKMNQEPQTMEALMTASDVIPPALMGLTSTLATAALDAAAWLSGRAPWLARMLTPPAAGINFIATNVPGAQVPLYLTGHKMVDYVGLIPLSGNLGYGVAIVSYNQDLFFGLMAEPNVMPDVTFMRDCVEAVFRELKAAAEARIAAAQREHSEAEAAEGATNAA